MFSPKLNQVSTDVVANILIKISRWVLVVILGLVPLLFIPLPAAPVNFSKVLIVVFAIAIALVFYSLAALRVGEITFKYSLGIFTFWGLVLVAFVSALLSGDVKDALVGDAFSIHTVMFLAILALVVSSVSILGKKKYIISLYTLLLSSGVLIGLYQSAKLFFGSSFLSLGFFSSLTSSPLGSWNDLALFFGLLLLLSLMMFEYFSLSKWKTLALSGVSVLSLFILAVVNFRDLWFVLGLSGLVILMYSLTKNRSHEMQMFDNAKNPFNIIASIIIPMLVFIVSAVFIIGSNSLEKRITNLTNVSYLEVRPSATATFDIMRSVYSENAFVGIGPNKFADAWRLYKNPGMNKTDFWNTLFSGGAGYIPTFAVTTGILGVLAWLAFLFSVLYAGFRLIFLRSSSDRTWQFVGVSSLVAALYLWGMSLVYIPGPAMLILAAIFSGLLFLTLKKTEPPKQICISILQNKQAGFVMVAITILVITTSLASLFFISRYYSSFYNFNQAIMTAAAGGSFAEVEQGIENSFALTKNDRFARELVGLQIDKMNAVLAVSEYTDVERKQFEEVMIKALQLARGATVVDASEPQNWIMLGGVYSLLLEAGITDAYGLSLEAYNQAEALDPTNPQIILFKAQLESRAGNLDQARLYAQEAIILKNNYSQAISFATQIDIVQGDIENAIRGAEASLVLDPNNAARYVQLGMLYLHEEDAAAAAAVLENAVRLNDQYVYGHYYLAVAYEQLGRTEEAIVRFEKALTLVPDNESVMTIIDNLKNGRSIGTTEIEAELGEESEEAEEVDATEGEEVVATEDPDSSLLTPVNTVPEADETEADQSDSQ